MNFKTIFACLLLAFSAAAATPAKAAFVINAHDGAVFAPSNVVVNPGDFVTVNFLLTESGTSLLDDPLTGLLFAEFTATVSGTQVTPTGFAVNPSFTDQGSGIAGQVVTISALDETFDGITNLTAITTANDTTMLDPLGNSVVLGSATFAVDLSATGTHTVTIAPETDAIGDRFFLAPDIFTALDIDPSPTEFTFTVAAVPEPSSCVVLMFACGTLGLSRRRKR